MAVMTSAADTGKIGRDYEMVLQDILQNTSRRLPEVVEPGAL